ncbi:hypothetical protein [Fusobacterium pseudoperiodonticum]|uniref:hypothetical protein n=1 Tax=Fusobacterium pseudoperiodonticum TaxID=2663009 RepID=UPI000C1BAD7C|nr:hypothetical protein [Fusobacterium pseudoperiodonticum]ATV68364.1 hypothetical protein CTM92_06980 [Fusobacterium pseudoperiodonticum]
MKKIILGLFLILGVVSFAAARGLDINKVNKAGYNLSKQDEFSAIIDKTTDIDATSIAIFFEIVENDAAKQLLDGAKKTAPEVLKLVNTSETKRAYIVKYKGTDGSYYSYVFVSKKLKFKDTFTTVIYTTDKDLNGSELDKLADSFFNQVESFLR